MSTGFSLLDEAWASHAMPLPPRKSSAKVSKRRKKSSAAAYRIAPLCENTGKVGETGFADSFQASLAPYEPIFINDDDARDVSGADSRKSRSKKSDRTKTHDHPSISSRSFDHDEDSIAENEDLHNETSTLKCPPPIQCPPQQIIRYAEPPKPPSDDRYDTFLYVFSGVLLLFLLEQFIQIGIQIGIKQATDF